MAAKVERQKAVNTRNPVRLIEKESGTHVNMEPEFSFIFDHEHLKIIITQEIVHHSAQGLWAGPCAGLEVKLLAAAISGTKKQNRK